MDVETCKQSPPHHGPRYVMLSENGGEGGLKPPPYRRNVPRYHSTARSRHSSACCCCLCCCCASFTFLLLIILLLSAYIYHLDPKVPNYRISNMKIAAFQLNPDWSLYTEFTVVVRAENPNQKVSIVYGKDGAVAVAYTGSTLCYGRIPSFYQGHLNTTVLNVVLKGKSEFGSGLQSALMDNRQSGRIPLDIFVKVPVSVDLGAFQTQEVTVVVHCALVVDNLSPHKKVNILSSKYDLQVLNTKFSFA